MEINGFKLADPRLVDRKVAVCNKDALIYLVLIGKM